MIAKRKYKLPFRKFFWYFRPFVLVFVFIVLVGCGLEYYSYSVNNANAETSELYRYSVLADKTDDNAFPNYSDYCEELNSVGINSANEYELFVDGYYDENNGLNTAALEKVADIQKRENPYNFFDNAGALFSDAWGHIINFDSISYCFCGNTCRYGCFCYRSEKKICLLPCFVFYGGICGLYVCSLCNGFFGIHNVRNFADDSFVYNVFV
ncbi:conserved hypothetical protein, membrane [human gut metagenome]|uniref:Uncharacterized protein n=1 Tax=human gut metagenome TaxID=408170 RepID=K1V821_9ZZZZ